jgi:hypothetical protein
MLFLRGHAMTGKAPPRLPKHWRDDAARAIRSFDPSIQDEAYRILRRRETEMALIQMMVADGGHMNSGNFYHALRICSDCATPRKPPFASRKRAGEIISAIDTLLRSGEIAFFLKESGDGQAARRQLEKAKKFAEEFSRIPKGARIRYEQQDCFLRLYKLFHSVYGRPVMKAIRSWMKSAFPGSERRRRPS